MMEILNKEKIKVLDRKIDEKVGYFSFLKTNILKFLKEDDTLVNEIKNNEEILKALDDDLPSHTKLLYFITVIMSIYSFDKYKNTFGKEQWIEHFIESVNNDKTDNQIMGEIKKLLIDDF